MTLHDETLRYARRAGLKPSDIYTISRPAIVGSSPSDAAPDATSPRSTIDGSITETIPSGGPTSPAARTQPPPVSLAPQGTTTTGGQIRVDTHLTDAAGSDHAARHNPAEAQPSPAGGVNVPGPTARETPKTTGGSLLDPALSLAADILDDIERVHLANANRLRQLTRTAVDKDGITRGFGYDESHPDVSVVAAMVEMLKKLEHDASLNLGRKLRKHPLGPWVKATKGVGEKQAGRLLAAIGDPYIRPEILNEDGSVRTKEGPRTVSALWAYAGLHVLPGGHDALDRHDVGAAGAQHRDTDPSGLDTQRSYVGVAAKRRKGERANWSTKAKMRAYLIAEKCVQCAFDPQCKESRIGSDAQCAPGFLPLRHVGRGDQCVTDTQRIGVAPTCACSPYRVVYDERRAHTAVTHPEWTDGHSHNDALRVASKEILKDLWRAARDWHLANGAKP